MAGIDRRIITVDDASAEELWKREKWGMYSASEIDVLAVPGKAGVFSDGANTYIEDVAREAYTLFNDDDNIETWSMRKGKMKEAQSFGHYRRLLGDFDRLEYFGGGNPYFEKYCADSGASPDCLAWIDKPSKKASFGTEFKNPNAKTHWEYLRTIKDQTDLKMANRKYFGQCQFGMMTFKTDLWHWCSYNEYFPFKDQMLIIEVKADKAYQSNLSIRLKMAVKKKWELIEEMKNR